MLNSAPINSWPLNALAGGAEQDDPVVIDPPAPPEPPLPGGGDYPGFPVPAPPAGHSFRWSAVVMLGGIDVTELVTGAVRVDREEGGAGIAEFGLFYMPGQQVQTDLADRTVTIDYITDDGQDAVQVRLFTGLVAEPRWDAVARVMRITATDNLQNRVEALSVAQIDTLAGGAWSADVFEPVDGRSRWDYAQERMSSRAASLDCDTLGELRTTSWYAKSAPDYIFGENTTVYQSLDVDLAQLRNVTNRVELTINYRYPRLYDARQSFSWQHPGTSGSVGVGGFCNWRVMPTELPNKDMVVRATEGANLTPLDANWYDLPPSMPDPCGTGQPWINTQEGLLLGASWAGARRWSQVVTETYKLSLSTETGEVKGQQVISRVGANISVEHSGTDNWESSLESESGMHNPAGDRSDEQRRVNAINCLLRVAHTEILAAHRKTAVTWSAPTSMALSVDLMHTVEVSDQNTSARAKCSHRIDELNFDTGSALTSITISVMRGGGVSDPLTIPDRLGANDSMDISGWGGTVTLPAQLGGRFASPAYDENLDGFSGNYDARQDNTLEVFPRRFAITAPEIPESYTDEKTHELERVYRVGIPNDLLEL